MLRVTAGRAGVSRLSEEGQGLDTSLGHHMLEWWTRLCLKQVSQAEARGSSPASSLLRGRGRSQPSALLPSKAASTEQRAPFLRNVLPRQPNPPVGALNGAAVASKLPGGSAGSRLCLERGWFVFVLAELAPSGGRPRQHERPNLQGPLCRGRDQWEMGGRTLHGGSSCQEPFHNKTRKSIRRPLSNSR